MIQEIEDQPALVWDTCDITNRQIDHLVDEEGMTQQAAEEQVYNDPDLLTHEWDYLCAGLTEFMLQLQIVTKKNGDKWKARVENFGWRHISGEIILIAEDGKTLLAAVLPKTDCRFNLYIRDDHIEINNAHHDAPTGGEMYYIYPSSGDES